MKTSIKVLIAIILLAFIFFAILIVSGSNIYTDYLWFDSLGFVYTFLVQFFSNFFIRITIGLIFTLFIFINLLFTKKPILNFVRLSQEEGVESIFDNVRDNTFLKWINNKRLTLFYLLVSVILGFLFSAIGQNVWQTVLKYFNQVSFDTVDPIFSRDISFYVFSLPFYKFIRELSMVLVVLTLIVVGIIYVLASGTNNFNKLAMNLSGRAKKHITLMITLFLLLKAWGYRLSMYDLLYSPRGVAFGASYTDIHANLLGLRILFFIAILAALLVLSGMIKRNYKILGYALGIWLLTSFIFGGIYPGLIQRFKVEPNELNREKPYIANNIEMTLKAYDIDDVEQNDFEVNNNLTEDVITEKEDIFKNVRLWDYRPLKTTYSQMQELRQYYTFNDVDIDRYQVNDEYRQVMLSLREMNQNRLESRAQTWINRTLQYTHGFGVTMSPVGEVTSEGLPEFFFKDIPPQTDTDLTLDNPSIYYGELTNNYVISNTNAGEFHYPSGDENVYINYTGTGGVKISNYFRKILFALRMNELKFLLSDDINSDSRVMFNRQIQRRVKKVAPFLKYDDDPYPVIAEGEIYWIQDAYTTSGQYPYSQPTGGIGNYIRNSIKIVIDAYNGNMKFYIIDEDDPLAMTYKNIFPDLFVSGSEMPKEIRRHIRYPVDLFKIQADIYRTYHMTDPKVFYNKEDLWAIPQENYAGTSIEMEPYYVINQLPGKDEPEFILMLPFTPARRDNMISWMAARSDGEKYGDVFLYDFPKDELYYGPNQLESRIDQHDEISQILSLWDQRGSRVIRGNLLVLPVENSIIYVEPVFLLADSGALPELRRVIVSYQERIAMRPTLQEGLEAVLKGEGAVIKEDIEDVEREVKQEPEEESQTAEPDGVEEEPAEPDTDETIELPDDVRELTRQASETYQNALESQRNGNWEQYGEYINQLEQILNKLEELSE